jgi:S1-C subfamily serine protease
MLKQITFILLCVAAPFVACGQQQESQWLYGTAGSEEPTLAPLLEAATPAVVNVSVVSRRPAENPLLDEPFLRRFFDTPDQLPRQRGVGSGVIVDAEQGLILSNHHVVQGAEEIVVVLSDRRRFDALGITIQDVTPALAEALMLDVGSGAIVADVVPGSSAEQAGILMGDIVVSVDGEIVRTAAELRNEIGLIRAGEIVTLGLIRDGERRTIEARVGAPSADTAATAPSDDDARPSLLDGAELRNLPPGHPQYGETSGVLVTDVRPGSAAALSGLRAEDVIVAVNRQSVSSVSELSDALDEAAGAVALTVAREDRRLFVLVR